MATTALLPGSATDAAASGGVEEARARIAERSHSPVGSTLRYIRLARAFGAPSALASDASPAKPALTVEGAAVAAWAATLKAAAGDEEGSEATSTAAETGLPQSALDAMCISESDGGETEKAFPHTNGCGFTQADLDAMAVRSAAGGEEGEEGERGEQGEQGEEGEEGAAVRRTSVFSMEEILYRARRLRAFRGSAEAASFAYSAMGEATSNDPACPSTGLSQAALDKLSIREPTGAAADDAADDKEAEEPEAHCSLVRRLRAYRGAAAAEELAEMMMAKAMPTTVASDASPSKRNADVCLPIDIMRCGSPASAASEKDKAFISSPGKEGKDPVEQVATPSRRRKSLRGISLSPAGPNCGGA